MESVSAIYSRIYEQLGNEKGKRSLERVKLACDQIEEARGIMSYAQVSRVATRAFGGPKQQTILNSGKLREYIGARIAEYERNQPSVGASTVDQSDHHVDSYPSQNLDLKTRVYIDRYRQRCLMLERVNYELSRILETQTLKRPPSLADLIELGSDEDGSLKMELPRPPVPKEVLEGIKKLLGLTEHVRGLAIIDRDSRRALIFSRPSGDFMVLAPAELAALEELVKETEDKATPCHP